MPHRRYLASRHAYGWIHKYIFPGGLIPSLEAIDRALHDAARRCASPTPPRSAATTRRTLRQWRERLPRPARARCTRSASTRTFVRMWEFYLAYCEAGFATGALGDAQLRLARA